MFFLQTVFAYPSAFHDVVEVTKPEYDSCQAVKPLITFANGNSIVPLTTPGKRFTYKARLYDMMIYIQVFIILDPFCLGTSFVACRDTVHKG